MDKQEPISDRYGETVGSSSVLVAPACLEDLSEMVEIHAATNPDSYLTQLGKTVLS